MHTCTPPALCSSAFHAHLFNSRANSPCSTLLPAHAACSSTRAHAKRCSRWLSVVAESGGRTVHMLLLLAAGVADLGQQPLPRELPCADCAADVDVEGADAPQLRNLDGGVQQGQDVGRKALPLPPQHQHGAWREGEVLQGGGAAAAARGCAGGCGGRRCAGMQQQEVLAAPPAAGPGAAHSKPTPDRTCSGTDSAVCSSPTSDQPCAACACSHVASAGSACDEGQGGGACSTEA